MRAFVPILGSALATAADAYLQSISPQAELERQKIQAARELLPLQVAAEKETLGLPPIKAAGNTLLIGRGGQWQPVQGRGEVDVKHVTGNTVFMKYPDGSYEFKQVPETDAIKLMQSEAGERIKKKLATPGYVDATGQWTDVARNDPDIAQDLDIMNRQPTTLGGAGLLDPYRRRDVLLGRNEPPPQTGAVPTTGTTTAPSGGQAPTTPGGATTAVPGTNIQPTPQKGAGGVIDLASMKTDEDILAFFSTLSGQQAYDLITKLPPNWDPKQKEQMLRLFPQEFGGRPIPTILDKDVWRKGPRGTSQQPPSQAGVAPPQRPGVQPIFTSRETMRREEAAVRAQEELRLSQEREARAGRQEAEKLKAEPTTKPDQAAATNQLFAEGKVSSTVYSELKPEEKALVNQHVSGPKEDIAFNRAMKQGQGYIDELSAIDNSANIVRMIEPLLSESTVGLKGFTNRQLNMLSQNVPGMPQAMKERLFVPGMNRLDVLTGMLTYLHAGAIKKLAGGGSMRGVIQPDIERAEALFNTKGWGASVAGLKEALYAVQDVIQQVRPKVIEDLANYGIDARTKPFKKIKGYNFPDAGTPYPGEKEGGTAAPGVQVPDGNSILDGYKE